ncbi:MAG: ABC transporter permease [Kiritimatiellaceae bacterium]|nr:ABC transporter permease [Kiritimatiellaceae bacterium]
MKTGSDRKAEVIHGSRGDAEIRFSGSFSLNAAPIPDAELLTPLDTGIQSVRLVDQGITEWDSSLPVTVLRIKQHCQVRTIQIDLSGLPEGLQRLIHLAETVPARTDTRNQTRKPSVLTQIGLTSIKNWRAFVYFLSFLGETTTGILRFCIGRGRCRPADLWLHIQQCGPQALGIVTLISVLVGAILAFVGAIQLAMFGAEIYVANLVGLGMVIEMGALMTGIILAGRTGASFAAQLGTMQVNEEIDALITLGIPPIDYLIVPRVVALAIMTPLLVIYADILGILGGAMVGIFGLDIPAKLFFNQTISMMSIWFCAQGLIKGSTFGIIVALAGCLRGIQCGRSASSVGEATTAAVVSGIVGIVIADAIWTFIFMMGGG